MHNVTPSPVLTAVTPLHPGSLAEPHRALQGLLLFCLAAGTKVYPSRQQKLLNAKCRRDFLLVHPGRPLLLPCPASLLACGSVSSNSRCDRPATRTRCASPRREAVQSFTHPVRKWFSGRAQSLPRGQPVRNKSHGVAGTTRRIACRAIIIKPGFGLEADSGRHMSRES